MNSEPVIDVEDLRKTYTSGLFGRRRVEALRGVSLSVGRGEIFGLLGPNGAGKTTLIKVLLGIVRRSAGGASLMGRPAGDRAGRRRVGYLPEGHRIPPHHTGNTALEYYGSLSGLAVGEIKRRRTALLELVGLADWGKARVTQYSKGMLQRLGLAQALLHDPDLLMLDEPTDGVDPVGRSEMRTLLKRLKGEGKTIFINSHLLQEIELVCDRVAILVQGRVERLGRVQELTVQSAIDVTWVLSGDESEIRTVLALDPAAPLIVPAPNQVQVSTAMDDQAVIDRAVDALRGRGVSIVALSRARRTLEEAFLETVQGPSNRQTQSAVM